MKHPLTDDDKKLLNLLYDTRMCNQIEVSYNGKNVQKEEQQVAHRGVMELIQRVCS